jgi:transcriptional regulator with XRE-family HTH domain
MSREAFGSNLRRIRLQRGITLQDISEHTKISVEMLAALERNDFAQWPYGIYARAYIRQYAYAVGVDPDATVDEFCRWFPQGDRRVEKVVKEHAEIVGHTELTWKDDVSSHDDRRGPRAVRSRRASAESASPLTAFFVRLRRTFGA